MSKFEKSYLTPFWRNREYLARAFIIVMFIPFVIGTFGMVLWENKDDIIEDLKELFLCAFFPWEN